MLAKIVHAITVYKVLPVAIGGLKHLVSTHVCPAWYQSSLSSDMRVVYHYCR